MVEDGAVEDIDATVDEAAGRRGVRIGAAAKGGDAVLLDRDDAIAGNVGDGTEHKVAEDASFAGSESWFDKGRGEGGDVKERVAVEQKEAILQEWGGMEQLYPLIDVFLPNLVGIYAQPW